MTRAAVRWLPALAWGATIFALSDRPRLPVALESGTDKIAHFGAYAVLGALIAYALGAGGWRPWLAALLAALYGATDEWHQSWVPGRAAEVADWVADCAGAITGAMLHSRFARTPRIDPIHRAGDGPIAHD